MSNRTRKTSHLFNLMITKTNIFKHAVLLSPPWRHKSLKLKMKMKLKMKALVILEILMRQLKISQPKKNQTRSTIMTLETLATLMITSLPQMTISRPKHWILTHLSRAKPMTRMQVLMTKTMDLMILETLEILMTNKPQTKKPYQIQRKKMISLATLVNLMMLQPLQRLSQVTKTLLKILMMTNLIQKRTLILEILEKWNLLRSKRNPNPRQW